MSQPANAARFGENGVGGTWYDPEYYPDAAAAEPVFAPRAAWLHAQYPSARIGVAGTGFGWVQYFLFQNHSHQSWGFDVQWAITSAQVKLGAWANFVMALDIVTATPAQLTTFRRMGMVGQQKYPVIFTEDLLPALSNDAEVATALANLRTVGTSLVHLVTPRMDDRAQTPDMLWHSPSEWRALVGSDRLILPDLTEVP